MTEKAALRIPSIQDGAHFEYVRIPSNQSFLWRKDDYPWIRSVWNYHPEFEIHLIRHSSGLAYIGDHIGNFEAGQLVLVGSNLPHNWITPSIYDQKLEDRDIVVQFDPERILKATELFPEMMRIPVLFERAALGMEFLGETAIRGAELLELMGQAEGFSQLNRLLALLAVLAESREYRTLATPQFASQFRPGTSRELKALKAALDYIQLNYLDNPKLSTLADLAGMSESTFSRFFKIHTGNNFSDHLMSLRIWTARKLLSDTETPVTDVCYQAGFNNISNFNRMFSRETGMTPSKYRRASRTKSIESPIGEFSDLGPRCP